MAISFSLNLTPGQIEFLQELDLYDRGVYQINQVGKPIGMYRNFVTHVQKLIREGLVIHDWVERKNFKSKEEEERHRFYKITDKGKRVLGMIDDDVRRFIARQSEIRRLRKRA